MIESHRTLATELPGLLQTWEVQPGQLTLGLSDATSGMAAAMVLAGRTASSQVISLCQGGQSSEQKTFVVDEKEYHWQEGNLWNEESRQARHDASIQFNRGDFSAAAQSFRRIESLVSGSQKSLYHGLAELSEGYSRWDHCGYRPAWEKLNANLKGLELASVWGGPPGLGGVLKTVKANVGFLERIVLDPQETKLSVAYDLLAHAKRRVSQNQLFDIAAMVLLRALEVFAQHHLWSQFKIKTWDATVDLLPQALQDTCQTCYLDDIDGKYKLPLHAQFRVLAGLGHPLGQGFLAEWTKMKPLLDAAYHSTLGHGFQSLKGERFHQLFAVVLKLTNVNEAELPRFPQLAL